MKPQHRLPQIPLPDLSGAVQHVSLPISLVREMGVILESYSNDWHVCFTDSSPFLPSQTNRCSSTEAFAPPVGDFPNQSPETCYSEDLFSHFDATSASMSMGYYSAPTSAGDQNNIDMPHNFSNQWDGSQHHPHWQFDNWLSGLPLDGMTADGKLCVSLSLCRSLQA